MCWNVSTHVCTHPLIQTHTHKAIVIQRTSSRDYIVSLTQPPSRVPLLYRCAVKCSHSHQRIYTCTHTHTCRHTRTKQTLAGYLNWLYSHQRVVFLQHTLLKTKTELLNFHCCDVVFNISWLIFIAAIKIDWSHYSVFSKANKISVVLKL